MKKILAAALAGAMSISLASVAFGETQLIPPTAPSGASGNIYELVGDVQIENNKKIYTYALNKSVVDATDSKTDADKLIPDIIYKYGKDDEDKEAVFQLRVKKDDKLRADVSTGDVTVSTKKFKDDDHYSYYKVTVKSAAGLRLFEDKKYTVEVDVADKTYYLKGKYAYSTVRKVETGDRLTVKKVKIGTEESGCMFDFDQVLDEEVRIHCHEYVDLYLKGNYGTDEENLEVSTDTIDEIEKYLDDDHDVDYYKFVATPKFAKAVTVIINADKDSFIYEYNNGDITKIDATYASDGWKFTTKQLGTYFVTEDEYEEGNVEKDEVGPSTEAPSSSAAADDTGKKNPGTGANDMVGAAAAAAVVSLVAAGAVAFKKSSK